MTFGKFPLRIAPQCPGQGRKVSRLERVAQKQGVFRRTGERGGDSGNPDRRTPFGKSFHQRRNGAGKTARIDGKQNGKIKKRGDFRAASGGRVRTDAVIEPHHAFDDGDIRIGEVRGK